MPRALILRPQRRSMVSSMPITTVASAPTKVVTSRRSSQPATARDDHTALLSTPPNNTQCRCDGSLAWRQDGACHQQQDVLPGRAGEKPGQAGEPRQQAFWQGGLVGRWDGIVVLHPMRRIDSTESQQALVGL